VQGQGGGDEEVQLAAGEQHPRDGGHEQEWAIKLINQLDIII